VNEGAAFDESQYEIYTSEIIPQSELNTESSSSTNNSDNLTFEQRTTWKKISWASGAAEFIFDYEKKKSATLVRKRTIPIERPPLFGEVSATFKGRAIA
jgi:hypothetical protein